MQSIKQNEIYKRYKTTALITGASNGIGEDFVNELSSLGFDLVIVARNIEKLNSLKEINEKKYQVNITTIEADLINHADLEKVFKICNTLDIGLIVLAAGFGTSGEFLNNSLKEELEMIQLNCNVVIEQTHHFGKKFILRKSGGIILFSSLVAFQGVANASNYSATKAFIQSFVEGFRSEVKKYNIDVIACAPGPVNSGFAERAKMKMGNAQKAKGIAKSTLKALGKSTTIRPGFLSKLLGYSLSTLPRMGRTLILNKIMGEMTSNESIKKTK